MTPTSPFTFQLGDPVEHRGIVITPLFPARDPIVAYITLDEALPRGLTITEMSDAGSVPELAVVNPLDQTVLLYELGRRAEGVRADCAAQSAALSLRGLSPADGPADVHRRPAYAVSVGMSSGSSEESCADVSSARSLAFSLTD